MQTRWVSIRHSEVTRGRTERSVYLRGLMGGKRGWNSRGRFSIKSPLKVSQGYMKGPLAFPWYETPNPSFHLELKGIKEGFSNMTVTLALVPICHTLSLWDVCALPVCLFISDHMQEEAQDFLCLQILSYGSKFKGFICNILHINTSKIKHVLCEYILEK